MNPNQNNVMHKTELLSLFLFLEFCYLPVCFLIPLLRHSSVQQCDPLGSPFVCVSSIQPLPSAYHTWHSYSRSDMCVFWVCPPETFLQGGQTLTDSFLGEGAPSLFQAPPDVRTPFPIFRPHHPTKEIHFCSSYSSGQHPSSGQLSCTADPISNHQLSDYKNNNN